VGLDEGMDVGSVEQARDAINKAIIHLIALR
jgi:hypothetical protein